MHSYIASNANEQMKQGRTNKEKKKTTTKKKIHETQTKTKMQTRTRADTKKNEEGQKEVKKIVIKVDSQRCLLVLYELSVSFYVFQVMISDRQKYEQHM
jgi:hypothetical protein